MTLNIIPFFIVLFFIAPMAHAEISTTYNCTFQQGYGWENDANKFNGKSTPDTLKFTLKANGNTGTITANAGESDVSVIDTSASTTFLEETAVGNLSVTTIFKTENARSPIIAAHSRHMSLLGNPIISQYVGTCKKTD